MLPSRQPVLAVTGLTPLNPLFCYAIF